jgi:hypothetical protein
MLNSKYMQRSGRFLGTARDTHVDWDEHFMIIFYDVLLLDDIVCIRESHDRRRHLLESLIHRIPGRADIGSREIIDLSSPGAPQLADRPFRETVRFEELQEMARQCRERPEDSETEEIYWLRSRVVVHNFDIEIIIDRALAPPNYQFASKFSTSTPIVRPLGIQFFRHSIFSIFLSPKSILSHKIVRRAPKKTRSDSTLIAEIDRTSITICDNFGQRFLYNFKSY